MFGKNQIVGQKYFDKAGDKLFVTSVFYTLQGEGPYRGEPAVFVRLAKCNLDCSFCFVPTTPILMGDGTTKNISDVKVGDQVMSWDGDRYITKPVTRTYENVATRLLKVEAGGRKWWVTPEHPFLTSTRGWTNAEDLQIGDKLVHFSISDRMTMFNPSKIEGYIHPPMSDAAREATRMRLSNLWKDPEFRANNIKRMREDNPMKDPSVALKGYLARTDNVKSKLEERFEKICDGLPISYIGDGSGETIAHRIPDFIVTDQKKVIEIWAADADFAKDRDDVWISKRKSLFSKHGYDSLFIPLTPADLKIDNHINIREQVARFVHNGTTVTSVTEVTENRAFARLYGSSSAERKVYNIEVADSHTYIANGCVVHNCDTFFDDGDWFTVEELDVKIDQVVSDYFKGDVPAWAQVNYESLPAQKGNGLITKVAKKRDMVLVVTGGEPMLQKNLVPFLEHMSSRFAKTQIESNGTIVQAIPASTTLVVSPKCSEKNGRAIKYLAPKPEMLARANCLKFVMNADPDSPYSSVPDWAHEFRAKGGTVFVSPMNIYNSEPMKSKQLRAAKNQISLEERSTVDEKISFWEEGLLDMSANQRNHEYAAKYCVNHGLILNLQIHLYASMA